MNITEPSTGPELLDLRGYRCPVPVIRLEAALRKLPLGAQVTVIADDPVAAIDIPHFCREGGHGVERPEDKSEGGDEVCVFLVTRGAKSA